MKSPPVAARRRCRNQSRTPASSTLSAMSWTRRMPATSGTVSMSKTSTGVIVDANVRAAWRVAAFAAGARCRPSRGKYAGGKVAVAAIAHDEHDRRVFDRSRNAQGHRTRAARADAAEDAFLARKTPRRILGVGLRDVFRSIHAAGIEYLRQVCGRPFADAGY